MEPPRDVTKWGELTSRCASNRTKGAAMAQLGTDIEEDLLLLDHKMKQLKMEYEQYFIGTRKREPQQTRGDVQRIITFYANVPIKNTANRFKFNNVRARFFTFRSHWDLNVRKMEEGTYERDVFKANMRERQRNDRLDRSKGESARNEDEKRSSGDLFEAYKTAREATGQGTAGLSPDKLEALIQKQEKAIRERYGVDQVKFRVVVEDGRAKLKAAPVRP
jgi:hypothetical protein